MWPWQPPDTFEISAGYPIQCRTLKQPGLDISLDTRADLIRAKRVTQFGLNLIIIGFSSLLYATDYRDGIVTWHFSCNEDGTQISFANTRVPLIASPKELLPSPKDVGQARHIVGWTNKVRKELDRYQHPPSRIFSLRGTDTNNRCC